jgi:polyribonucleotide nucleotidyltransferase
LEQGIVGILKKSDIAYRRFDHVSDCLEREQRIQVKIKKCYFDMEDPERPFRLMLSHKDIYSREKSIPNGKMGLIIGANGSTIKSLQEQSGCSIRVAQNSSFVTITGNSEESIEKAFQMIDRHLAAPREKAEWIKKDDTKRKYTTSRKPPNIIKADVIIPGGKRFLNLIGKGGETVRRLNRESGCKIHCGEGLVKIDGPRPENIKTAFSLIQKIIPKAIMRDKA